MRLPSSGKPNYLPLVTLLACACTAQAESPAAIGDAVERAARMHLVDLAATAGLRKPSVEVAALPRNTVEPCTQNARIDALDTRSVTRMRFTATCDDAGAAWSTEFIVRGSVTADVVVAAADVRAGSIIDAAALAIERRELANGADALSDPAAIEGKSSRRALRRGQVVSRRWLIEPMLVKRGADVNIVARNTGVEVRVAGEALGNGRRDDIVTVRNKTNGNTLRARVIGDNTVEPVDAPTSPPSR